MQIEEKPTGDWLRVTDEGLYCLPGDLYIDPVKPVDRALITHGHADHARPNHRHVLATAETLAIMRLRYREAAGAFLQAIPYGEAIQLNGVKVTFFPAGHILGSAQILLEYGGFRVVASGDYKRRRDPTCTEFDPVPCDVFITEATFGLPVFRHPPDSTQIEKLLNALAFHSERCVLVGVYSLGKCQRLIRRLRESGYEAPIYLHGAMVGLCELYQLIGLDLGPLTTVSEADQGKMPLHGKLILCPPSAVHDRWSRRLPDPVTAMASGWMTVRARARQKRVELPLIISDHADWDELTQTIRDVGASEIWVTHGRDDALIHYASTIGLNARPLDLRGFEEEGE